MRFTVLPDSQERTDYGYTSSPTRVPEITPAKIDKIVDFLPLA